MNPLAWIPGFSWMRAGGALALALALAAGALECYHLGRVSGRVEVQLTLDAERLDRANERLDIAKKTLRVIENNTRSSDDLQKKADQTRKALRDKVNQLDTDLAATVRMLSDRPQRPANGDGSVPASAGDRAGGPGATGAGLYREDGQFLAGFARDTSVLQAGLKACYRDYDALAEKLKALQR